MPDILQIDVGRVDRARGTVRVTFTKGSLSHARTVNAVFAADGSHDRAATLARVSEVAAGVERKFELGLIGEEA